MLEFDHFRGSHRLIGMMLVCMQYVYYRQLANFTFFTADNDIVYRKIWVRQYCDNRFWEPYKPTWYQSRDTIGTQALGHLKQR